MDAMAMLNETMNYGGKGSSLGMWTYSETEGGLSLPYQLSMTVRASVDNLSSKTKNRLVSHMKKTLGYSKCEIDKQNNTIYVESIDGINSSSILEYIRIHIDGNAREG